MLMQTELIVAEEPSPSSYLVSRTTLLSQFARIFFYIFLTITALAVFVPLSPSMPTRGIDPSYGFAMNQAVARHLSFGREIVFTYGPYASICTRMYDPATDRRMLWGSLLFAASFLTALLFLARDQKRYLIPILLLFFATFGNAELLLISYPFLLVLCVLKQTNSDDPDKRTALNWKWTTAVIVMWSTLGLLPLVKGSLLLPFAASVAIPSALLLYRARFGQALLLLLTPIAASLSFWIIAGQSLVDIAPYLRGIVFLTSGYTEAMATSWSVLPAVAGDLLVIAYLVTSGLICVSVARCHGLRPASRWALGLLCALFLVVAFKRGFVGAQNLSSAFALLAVYILIIGFIYMDRWLVWSLAAVMIVTAATSVIRDRVLTKEVHERFGVGAATGGGKRADILAFCLQRAFPAYSRTTYKSTWRTYSDAWKGLYSRVIQSDALGERFAEARSNIRKDGALPALKGTADFYEYDQAVLLASDNTWNPRPVIQSYSAYTPALAILDEQHLRGQDAPDWVLFNLETIDERLPSLDDGLSWSALLDNYSLSSYDGRDVIMHKNRLVRPSSSYESVSSKTYKTGATVTLPETDGPLFAEVDLKPTLAGQSLTALFTPPQLHIVLGLDDGKTKVFRVVSNMMRTKFLLSPLVSNTTEFAALMTRSKDPQHEDAVRTISIEPSYGGSLYWSGTYELTLKRYVGQ